MADFVLGRLKFTFLGPWVTGTSYIKDDIVNYGGQSYACTGNHTANANFYTDLGSGNWSLIAGGLYFKGAWNISTYYKLNDIVQYGGNSYVCTTPHTSTTGTIYDSFSNWTLYTSGLFFRGPWTANTQYNLNDIVRYGADSYVVTIQHVSPVSANGFQVTANANYQLLTGGLEFENDYNGSTYYSIGDVVRYGGYVWVAVKNTQGNLPTDTSNWTVLSTGFNARGVYNPSTQYLPGDVVNYGAYNYVAKITTTGNLPSSSGQWSLVSKGTEYLGTYNPATAYVAGDVVRFGGNTYIAVTETTGTNPTVANSAYWTTFTTGLNWKGTWANNTTYQASDVVGYANSSFISVSTNNLNNVPNASANWQTLVQGSPDNVMQQPGDITIRNGVNSTVRLPAGANGQVLVIGSSGLPQWENDELASNVYYVSPDGQDDSYHGGSLQRPWKTIQYACQQINKGTIKPNAHYLLAQNRSWLVEEMYYWMMYEKSISASPFNPSSTFDATKTRRDAGYVIDALAFDMGTGGNSQTVSSALSYFMSGTNTFINATVATEMPYIIAALTQLGVLIGNAVSNSTPAQSYQTLMSAPTPVSQTINTAYTPESGAYTTLSGLLSIITTALNTVNGLGIPRPILTCRATLMLKAGLYQEQLPITVPPGVSLVGDSTRTTEVQPAAGLSLDGVTPNNQSTMFLLSDSTMLTHFTFKGMTGYLPPPAGTNASIVTASTSVAGVFLAFNPVSPIVIKSPYVNDMTAISSGGVGALVDGGVHAIGYKTMLFHSYTQVHDNGVGFYVTNQAHAEIVSCFTYFCYFGYTTANGGVIRSLNGNNSYGTYGAVSNGFDPAETPTTANVYGQIINYIGTTLTPNGAVMSANSYVKGLTSGATGLILTMQPSVTGIYIKKLTGNFANNEIVREYSDAGFTVPTGTYANTQTTGVETGESGFIITVNNTSGQLALGQSVQFTTGSGNTGYDPYSYVVSSLSTWGGYANTAIVTLTSQKPSSNPTFDGQQVVFRNNYSQVRLTGHDFLNIGTGGVANTNYPNLPLYQPVSSNQVVQNYPGRVYYVTTDQSGNFTVGQYFSVNQATGAATLNASSFNLSGLSSLRLGSIGAQLGAQINEFSTDGTMAQNSSQKVPTQSAVVTYVSNYVATATPKGTPLTNVISTPTTLSANTMAFSMNALTIAANTTYTIAPGAYHFIMSTDGFALFN
jgi:hypothetical protein